MFPEFAKGNLIPRKPQYGWPGDRWKNEEDWAHDLYVEVQIWDDPRHQGN